MLQKILVANRGEIACRIIRSAEAMGIRCVAVFSDTDRAALHVREAREAIRLGPAAPRESYLHMERVLEAAMRTGCDAVHPGYGFLAENAAFAEACHKQGLVFVGPSPRLLELMGDKARAKKTMAEAGVPVLPGVVLRDGASREDIQRQAADIGYPLLVKAVGGGGGKGMRRVDTADKLGSAIERARSEAEAAFGCSALMLEHYLPKARHVEVQIAADRYGNSVHFFERDCSVQRRHQKLIEESPAPGLSDACRQALYDAALRGAGAVGYEGLGTMEFLVTPDESFRFIEMNPRLQVEHPVSEALTGFDLVTLQLRLASGEPLGIEQGDISRRGHAIEARLCSEDPAQNFNPATGNVLAWQPDERPGIRVDGGIETGSEVSADYDSLLAKVIAVGSDRTQARRRLRLALEQTVLLGPTHNRDFLCRVLDDPGFIKGGVCTTFLAQTPSLARPEEATIEGFAAAAVLFVEHERRDAAPAWSGAWPEIRLTLETGSQSKSMTLQPCGRSWVVCCAGRTMRVELDLPSGLFVHEVPVMIDGHRRWAHVGWEGATLHLALDGCTRRYQRARLNALRSERLEGTLRAPMSGRVLAVLVNLGQEVRRGQQAVVLEAMKLETPVTSPIEGKVVAIRVTEGDHVKPQQCLVMVARREGEPSA